MPCVWFATAQPSSEFDIALCVVGTTTRSYVRSQSSATPLHSAGFAAFTPRVHVCGSVLVGRGAAASAEFAGGSSLLHAVSKAEGASAARATIATSATRQAFTPSRIRGCVANFVSCLLG